MHRPTRLGYLGNALVATVAVLFVGARYLPSDADATPVASTAVSLVSGAMATPDSGIRVRPAAGSAVSTVAAEVAGALDALAAAVRPVSHPQALESAFRSYFAYRAANPDVVTKPYLYFVDYGLSSTERRGWVFDMETLEVVEGPFTVAHGRGSSATRNGVPTRFSNVSGSAATSLGLYVAQELYDFRGTAGGQKYRSIGLRMKGVSGDYNDNARARGVVAHGAPYVTASGAGRSEGCPAVEPGRAERLLPKLANGGMIFLFAPDARWMAGDPWIAAGAAPATVAQAADAEPTGA